MHAVMASVIEQANNATKRSDNGSVRLDRPPPQPGFGMDRPGDAQLPQYQSGGQFEATSPGGRERQDRPSSSVGRRASPGGQGNSQGRGGDQVSRYGLQVMHG